MREELARYSVRHNVAISCFIDYNFRNSYPKYFKLDFAQTFTDLLLLFLCYYQNHLNISGWVEVPINSVQTPPQPPPLHYLKSDLIL